MRIFFTASLRGKATYLDQYKSIYKILKEKNQVFCEHIFSISLKEVKAWDADFKFDYYQRVLYRIHEAELVVADITFSSINVGYEINIALQQKKPVIALYNSDNIPKIVEDIVMDDHEQFTLIQYNRGNLKRLIIESLDEIKKTMNQRFTIILPAQIINYLDKVTKKNHTSRADYIRTLIAEDMKK